MKQNFTVRQGARDGVEAFLSVAQHRSFRRAASDEPASSRRHAPLIVNLAEWRAFARAAAAANPHYGRSNARCAVA
jgi:hypothetical protein